MQTIHFEYKKALHLTGTALSYADSQGKNLDIFTLSSSFAMMSLTR